MKINFAFFSSLLVSASFVIFLGTLHRPSEEGAEEHKALGGPETVGEEGPGEWLSYEINRLRDPETGLIPYGIRQKELEFASTLPSDAMVQGRMNSQAVWSQRGPWNVGGRTRAFGIDVADTNIYVAGGTSSGMWRSTNRGQTWTRTFNNIQYESITCLAQDKRPGKTSTWYAGAGEAYGASASASGAYYLGNGMWKSTDNGLTWSILSATSVGNGQSFTSPWDVIWNVVTDPSDTVNDEVYAADYGYIYRSVNGGTTWTGVKGSFNSTSAYFTDVAVTDSGVVYATFSSDGGTNKGIWRSTDGISWTDITPTNFPTTFNRIVIGIAPGDQDQVWFLGNTPGFGQPDTNFVGDVEWNSLWKYDYLSGNGSGSGGLWSDRSSALPTTGGLFDKFNCQGSYDLVVKVHPNDTNTVFIGGTNLYRSTNGFTDDTQTAFIGGYEQGATLPVVNVYANHHPDQHGLQFVPGNPSELVSYNDGGMFRTSDCLSPSVSWNSLNDGYVTSLFYTVAVDHATPNNDVVIGGAQDNGSWFTNNTNLQTPWVTPRGGDGSYCQIEDGRANYYFSIQNGKMMKATLDANGNVQTFARIDPIGGTGYQFINPYILDPNNNNIMYLAGGKRLWRNSDLSQIPMVGNWDSISTNWTSWSDTVPISGATITAVTVSKTPANRVYYGTSYKKIYRVDNANTGTPTPVEITSTAPSVVMPGGNVSCMATNPDNADELLVCYSNYNVQSLFYSPTGGVPTTNWTRVGGNLEATNGPSVRWAVVMPVSDGKVYMVATSSGIYATDTLTGSTTVWVKQGANTIGNAICDMIDYRRSDGLVVVATHGHGMYSTHITSVNDIVTIRDIENSRSDFQLTNYPNPFSSSTTIAFSLEKRADVHLSVMDLSGHVVSVLADEKMDSGLHTLVFNRSGLSSGTYFICLRAGELYQARKILIVQ
jgi:photosystem II stability/assembly factor-like uncharacterized protein